LKEVAKANLEDGAAQLRRWWSQKYSKPPNHPLLEQSTAADLYIELYEDLLLRRNTLREELDDRTQDPEKVIEKINEINKTLGDKEEVWDPLVAKWDRELAEGKIPDLDEDWHGA
jgi:hypothetical protein